MRNVTLNAINRLLSLVYLTVYGKQVIKTLFYIRLVRSQKFLLFLYLLLDFCTLIL